MKLSRFLPGVIWLSTSFYLFTLPGNRLPKYGWFEKLHGDKFVHIGIFTLLVSLFLWPFFNQQGVKIKRVAFLLAVAGVLYGTAIEFIQGNYIPSRSFEVTDIMADSVGCFLPLAFLVISGRKKAVA